VSHALRHDIGVQPTGLEDAGSLMLERRRGNPLLLAVVAVELARRAGVEARLYSTPVRWFAGFGEPVALVELSAHRAALPSPDLLGHRCPHAVAAGAIPRNQPKLGSRRMARAGGGYAYRAPPSSVAVRRHTNKEERYVS
jgi:transglutaminase-like putative cysteine protease